MTQDKKGKMLLLPIFVIIAFFYTFHDLMKIGLTMMVTSIGRIAWYLKLIHKLLGDIQV